MNSMAGKGVVWLWLIELQAAVLTVRALLKVVAENVGLLVPKLLTASRMLLHE